MTDARASAPWETIRFGLRLLAGAWGAGIALSIVNRLVWSALFAAMSSGALGSSGVSVVMGAFAFVMQIAFTALAVTLVVAASRLMRFPLVPAEPRPADPYRGPRDAAQAPDPGLDGVALLLVVGLASSAGLGVLSYLIDMVLPFLSRAKGGFGVHEVLGIINLAVYVMGPVAFVIWSSRAARVVGRPLSPALPIAAFLGLLARTGIGAWSWIDPTLSRAHAWFPWLTLALNVVTTGVLIAVALSVVEAIRDQPREATH